MSQANRKNRATSQDVAELAGVSITTVSFVVNNKKGGNVRISEETRKRVWDAVKALNYRPMAAARMLRTNRSNLLALMIPHIETPFQPLLAGAVQREAEKKGLDVIIYATNDEAVREEEFVRNLIARGADAAIIHSHRLNAEDLEQLVTADVAVVVHGQSPTHPYVDNVMLDETGAARKMTSYLISQGHRRIGALVGPQATWGGRLRQEGYQQALADHDLPLDEALIYEADFFQQGAGRAGMDYLLSLSQPPTAVFAASDMLAVEALLCAVDCGLDVPQEIAVTGFDNTRESTMVRPQLTTVEKDVDVLSRVAVRLLMERIDSSELLPARQEIIPYQIIYRQSA